MSIEAFLCGFTLYGFLWGVCYGVSAVFRSFSTMSDV